MTAPSEEIGTPALRLGGRTPLARPRGPRGPHPIPTCSCCCSRGRPRGRPGRRVPRCAVSRSPAAGRAWPSSLSVRVSCAGVALSPERVPRLLVSVPGRGQLLVLGVYVGGARPTKDQGYGAAFGWLGPFGIDLPCELRGVLGYMQARRRGCRDVRLTLDSVGDVKAEPAI
jgi:hypothetical protein